MPLAEFKLIEKYFTKTPVSGEGTVLGIGDDAAIVYIPNGYKLVTSVTQQLFSQDSCNSDKTGVTLLNQALIDFKHLYPDSKAEWATLSISLSTLNENWLLKFSQEFYNCALKHNIQLIGGDTSKGQNILRINLSGLDKLSV